MTKKDVLKFWEEFSKCIADEIAVNEGFSEKIGNVFGKFAAAGMVLEDLQEVSEVEKASKVKPVEKVESEEKTKPVKKSKSKSKREKSKIDPYALFEKGLENLTEELDKLDINELKDVIAEYDLDPTRMATRWRKRERLVNQILDTTKSRATRGSVFLDME